MLADSGGMNRSIFALSLVCCWLSNALAAQSLDEATLARETLRKLQAPSFEKQSEFCGYLGYNGKGQLIATEASRGDEASCSPFFPKDFAPVASYHTHGGFDEEYMSEVPSDIDVEGDAAERVNGYISTPGGRLWYVDSRKMEVRQLCGLGCLPVAPDFVKGADGKIEMRYSYEELLKKLEEY